MLLLQWAQAEDGLFIGLTGQEKESIRNGALISRLPLQRVQVDAVVLRPDTEDPKLFWLELHLHEYRDPGDFIYCLVAYGKLFRGQMAVRPSEQNPKDANGRWK